MKDPIVPFSEVSQVTHPADPAPQVPEPSDVQGTLKYWDNYRAQERQRFAAMGMKTDEAGNRIASAAQLTIGNFPTTAALAALAVKYKQLDANFPAALPKPLFNRLWNWIGSKWKR